MQERRETAETASELVAVYEPDARECALMARYGPAPVLAAAAADGAAVVALVLPSMRGVPKRRGGEAAQRRKRLAHRAGRAHGGGRSRRRDAAGEQTRNGRSSRDNGRGVAMGVSHPMEQYQARRTGPPGYELVGNWLLQAQRVPVTYADYRQAVGSLWAACRNDDNPPGGNNLEHELRRELEQAISARNRAEQTAKDTDLLA